MDNLPLKFLVLFLLCISASLSAQTNVIDRRLPIVMDADHSELDLKTSTTVFYGLRITQGATRIEADNAETSSGTSFADSKWEFEGDVQIDVGTTKIRADSAVLTFLNHELVNAEVGGKPATFSDINPGTGESTEGAAKRFDYDLSSNTVRFEDDAKLRSADNEVTGKLLVYNVTNQQIVFEGDPQSGERVRITVQPPAAEDSSSSEDDPANPDP
ncbi:MAG: lipopolysaccharide transport periplasmic protein LptA [Woeseiaceae bacterium]